MRFVKYCVLWVTLLIALSADVGASENGIPTASQWGVEQVRAKVDGLACPFCAFNIEKRVKTLEGIDRDGPYSISVETGLATFAWQQSVPFDPASVKEQIKRSGFTPGTINVTVSGQVSFKKPTAGQEKGKLVLRLPNLGQEIALSPAEPADRAESFSSLYQKAERLAQDAVFPVRIEAAVVEEIASWSLVLQSWEPMVYGAKVVVKVDTLACEMCATRAMRAGGGLKGVIHIEADHSTDQVTLWMTSAKPNSSEIKTAVHETGFRVTELAVVPAGEKDARK